MGTRPGFLCNNGGSTFPSSRGGRCGSGSSRSAWSSDGSATERVSEETTRRRGGASNRSSCSGDPPYHCAARVGGARCGPPGRGLSCGESGGVFARLTGADTKPRCRRIDIGIWRPRDSRARGSSSASAFQRSSSDTPAVLRSLSVLWGSGCAGTRDERCAWESALLASCIGYGRLRMRDGP